MRVCIQFLKNIDKEGEDVIQSEDPRLCHL